MIIWFNATPLGAGCNCTRERDDLITRRHCRHLRMLAIRLEFAGGVTYKLNPSWSFYAQAGYEFATESNIRRDGVKGDLGLRVTW